MTCQGPLTLLEDVPFCCLLGHVPSFLVLPCPTSRDLWLQFHFLRRPRALPAAKPAEPSCCCSSGGGAEQVAPVATFSMWGKAAVRLPEPLLCNEGCLPSPDLSKVATLRNLPRPCCWCSCSCHLCCSCLVSANTALESSSSRGELAFSQGLVGV